MSETATQRKYSREQIVNKVQKMIAVANNTTYEAEATTALAMAQKLLAEYDMDMRDLPAAEREKPVIVTLDVHSFKQKLGWIGTMATIVANNFRCIVYWWGNGDRTFTLKIMGHATEATLASELMRAALLTAERLASLYIRQKERETGRALGAAGTKETRNAYVMGFTSGLYKQFQKQTQEWGLVLVLPEDVKTAQTDLKLRKSEKSTAKYDRDRDAFSAGYEQGNTFDAGRKQLGAGDETTYKGHVIQCENDPERGLVYKTAISSFSFDDIEVVKHLIDKHENMQGAAQ